ncbi:hypothetical protein RchiOBHm_Chr3g0483321 [Rosa chinensis]|uniref:Uncharacterized protein n=1 Tax=Rosa chinensis TaxID=74649 RepID=A0A2P6REF7_ROSCH|nr:hypothetical protein RchiOBHm_Chr3g0483321 [Rosa chinensis]
MDKSGNQVPVPIAVEEVAVDGFFLPVMPLVEDPPVVDGASGIGQTKGSGIGLCPDGPDRGLKYGFKPKKKNLPKQRIPQNYIFFCKSSFVIEKRKGKLK